MLKKAQLEVSEGIGSTIQRLELNGGLGNEDSHQSGPRSDQNVKLKLKNFDDKFKGSGARPFQSSQANYFNNLDKLTNT